MEYVVGWQEILVLVCWVFGAVGTAIRSYFHLHEDLRNRDGTMLTAREQWRHILGLLAFFVLGGAMFGGGCVVALRIFDAL